MQNRIQAQWVCSRERRIALYKRSSINQSMLPQYKMWQCSLTYMCTRPKWTESTSPALFLSIIPSDIKTTEFFSMVSISWTIGHRHTLTLYIVIITTLTALQACSSPVVTLKSALTFVSICTIWPHWESWRTKRKLIIRQDQNTSTVKYNADFN